MPQNQGIEWILYLKVTSLRNQSSRDFQKLPSFSVLSFCDYPCTVFPLLRRYTPSATVSATAELFALNGSLVRTASIDVGSVAPDGNIPVHSIRGWFPLAPNTGTTILRLRLTRTNHTSPGVSAVYENVYWLPNQPDKFEMGGCFTGCKMDKFADMQDLGRLARVTLVVSFNDTTTVPPAALATPLQTSQDPPRSVRALGDTDAAQCLGDDSAAYDTHNTRVVLVTVHNPGHATFDPRCYMHTPLAQRAFSVSSWWFLLLFTCRRSWWFVLGFFSLVGAVVQFSSF